MIYIVELKYGNTNTFFIRGRAGNLLVDTDYAGTLSPFYKAIKEKHIDICEIDYILATHYHPDHIGLVSELMKQGVKLLLIDKQKGGVHFSDALLRRNRHLHYEPIREENATVIRLDESRCFLKKMGIDGEIIATESHSADGIALMMDDGHCIVGDLEPFEYLGAYDGNEKLKCDWERILRHDPKVIYYGHANKKYRLTGK